MVGGQLDGPLVQRGQEGFGERHLRHDDLLESGVEAFLGEEGQGEGCYGTAKGLRWWRGCVGVAKWMWQVM